MEWLDYRQHLSVGFCDKERGDFFVAQAWNFLLDLQDSRRGSDVVGIFDFNAVSDEEYYEFCRVTGTQRGHVFSINISKIQDVLDNNKDSLQNFLSYYIAFVNCLLDRENGIKKKDLLEILDKAFKESRLQYAILNDEGKYFVFPKGAKALDDALVSEPLEWLKDYPKAYKTFCNALKQYANGEYIRDAADNFRKALEEFFQEFLGNGKNLDNNITEIFQYLNENNAEPELAGMIKSLLNSYDKLNNKTAKHNDKIDGTYLEFLMYQTGIFIRMLIVVKTEKNK